jgi:ribosomal 50S subunit-recycling heat shock protein
VILRRTLAKETCDAGRVTVNGQEARAGREIRVGDTISIRLPRRLLTFRVRSIPTHAPGKEASRELIEIVNSP